jgi:hypothetical protein
MRAEEKPKRMGSAHTVDILTVTFFQIAISLANSGKFHLRSPTNKFCPLFCMHWAILVHEYNDFKISNSLMGGGTR